MYETNELLNGAIGSAIDGLSSLDIGSKEYSMAVNDICKLHQISISDSNLKQEVEFKKQELRIKEDELEFKKKESCKNEELKKQELHIKEDELEFKKQESCNEVEFKKQELRIKEDELEFKKQESCKNEEKTKLEQKQSKLDMYIRIGLAGAELLIPLIFYGIWMKRGFEFEKEGTFTSTTFRGLFSHFRPKQK